MTNRKKLTLFVKDELWNDFKKTITKDKTLNEAIVDLIQEEINKRKK